MFALTWTAMHVLDENSALAGQEVPQRIRDLAHIPAERRTLEQKFVLKRYYDATFNAGSTELAALVLPAVGSNHERHPKLQRFMLANDSTTIAVEVPVWLTHDDIAALQKEGGIRLLSGDPEATITGHIDFLQVRNGAVHILDYKPDARTNRPIAQLTIYALALSRLTGLKLFDIKCAWFSQDEYCEFFPRTLFLRPVLP
jgi:ATP-dependent exoDNAse (exonuclease V) beta subunit